MNKKSKLAKSIRGKLISATCMLLVAMIMVVSSTYAWFTLSTAPEVTGISTAVGANGALEIALLPSAGASALSSITSGVGDSIKPINERNLTWGNLIDLSNNTFYGLDKITLYPSALNVTGNTLQAAPLVTPQFGADGRVSQLSANTVFGTYDSTAQNFPVGNNFGVRAVGVASGMTPRQLDYRNALSAANTSTATAKTKASQSLNNNGSALANIVVKHAAAEGSTETYTDADIASLLQIVGDLKEKILPEIENAYLQYILALSASNTSTDEAWKGVKALVTAEGATIANVRVSLAELGINLSGTALATALDAYEATLAKVNTANSKLTALTGNSYTWTQLYDALQHLVNPDTMKINGYDASTFRDNMSNIINSVASGGLTVAMATGGGVYADIADHCGNYNASVVIEEVTYGGLTLTNMNARMETATTVTPLYLTSANGYATAGGAPENTNNAVLPISEFYGYIIDLAFRTNAANSNLLLQTNPIDRIYSDNTNDQTMGHGATMTFASTTTDFSNEQVKELMECIRIVFFNPADNSILAYAKLNMTSSSITADGVTANIYLYTPGSTEVTYVAAADGTYKKVGDNYVEITEGETVETKYKQVITTTEDTLITNQKDAVITALTQNTAQAVSTLVYLDGEHLTNADVAATAATSMTGKLNLQFSSSATLVPMEYADLHTPAQGGADDDDDDATTATGSITIDLANATTGTVATENAASYVVTSGENVTVAADGTVTATAAGTATIVAKNASGETLKTWTVTVTGTSGS